MRLKQIYCVLSGVTQSWSLNVWGHVARVHCRVDRCMHKPKKNKIKKYSHPTRNLVRHESHFFKGWQVISLPLVFHKQGNGGGMKSVPNEVHWMLVNIKPHYGNNKNTSTSTFNVYGFELTGNERCMKRIFVVFWQNINMNSEGIYATLF